MNKKDLILIFSVGGGNLKKVSVNIINALKYANTNKIKSICFVGKRMVTLLKILQFQFILIFIIKN